MKCKDCPDFVLRRSNMGVCLNNNVNHLYAKGDDECSCKPNHDVTDKEAESHEM